MGKFRRRTRRRNKSKKGTRKNGGMFSGTMFSGTMFGSRKAPPAQTTFYYNNNYNLYGKTIKNITYGAEGVHKWPDSIIEFSKPKYEYASRGIYDLEKKFVDNYMQSCFHKLLEKAGIDEHHTHIKDKNRELRGKIISLCYGIKTKCKKGEESLEECRKAIIHFFIEVDRELGNITSIKKFGHRSLLNSGLHLVHLGHTNKNCAPGFTWDCKGVEISEFFVPNDPNNPNDPVGLVPIKPTFVGETVEEAPKEEGNDEEEESSSSSSSSSSATAASPIESGESPAASAHDLPPPSYAEETTDDAAPPNATPDADAAGSPPTSPLPAPAALVSEEEGEEGEKQISLSGGTRRKKKTSRRRKTKRRGRKKRKSRAKRRRTRR